MSRNRVTRHVPCIDCGITRTIKYTGPVSDRCPDCAQAHAGHLRRAKDPGPWIRDGLCAQVDTDMHFLEKGGNSDNAKQVCAACTVRETCLDYAIDTDQEYGIWGGMTRRQRNREAKRREAA